ncbi:uncharacterized protein LOC127102246 [Lathyrus oleraceus]|uniref:uncharacterized protein LOC127102246 n=1 Tax=Pisum sativum TaxID=3888 RepID=UPI0021D321FA|nr:uncharacterized protein LOC127102246 [Pisum sativum]
MSKQSSPKHMHVSTETSGSSSPTARADEPFQMINLSDLVLDVAPLSMIHPSTQKKATPSISKNVKTSGKSSIFEPTILSGDKTVVEEGSRSKVYEMRNPTKHTGVIENQTGVERITIDKIKKKVDECVLEQATHERISKKKDDHVVNVDDLTSDKEPFTNIMTLGIAKRLPRRKGKVMMFEDSPSKEVKRKSGGMKSTPSRSSKGKSHVGPARSWSKVNTPTRKRKVVYSSDYEFEVEEDVQDITYVRRYAKKKPYDVVPVAPLDNNAGRCEYVIQRRIAFEREFGKDALKCKEVVELIEAVGLMKIVTNFGPCYESLVKEFVVTIPDGCDDVKSKDYRKVYVKGNVIKISPDVINKFQGRTEEPQAELEITDDQVCKEITAKQLKKRESPLSLDYKLFAGTHFPNIVMTSSQLKKTCKELDDFIRSSTATKIKLEKLIKALMEEEEKEAEHGGDDNVGADVEDSAGGNDVENDEEVEEEEYATTDSYSQEDI